MSQRLGVVVRSLPIFIGLATIGCGGQPATAPPSATLSSPITDSAEGTIPADYAAQISAETPSAEATGDTIPTKTVVLSVPGMH